MILFYKRGDQEQESVRDLPEVAPPSRGQAGFELRPAAPQSVLDHQGCPLLKRSARGHGNSVQKVPLAQESAVLL